MKKHITLFLLSLLIACSTRSVEQSDPNLFQADVIVYGGTSAGVIAAVQVKRMGKSVILVSPDAHLGGLSSGGLGFTDTGNNVFQARTLLLGPSGWSLSS